MLDSRVDYHRNLSDLSVVVRPDSRVRRGGACSSSASIERTRAGIDVAVVQRRGVGAGLASSWAGRGKGDGHALKREGLDDLGGSLEAGGDVLSVSHLVRSNEVWGGGGVRVVVVVLRGWYEGVEVPDPSVRIRSVDEDGLADGCEVDEGFLVLDGLCGAKGSGD